MFNFFKPKHDFSRNKIAPVALIVLDGWGVAPPGPGNAVSQAKLPTWNSVLQTYPNGQLIASGESVGLPANEVGNTEVGHLTMGAGRVIFQDVKRISGSIADGSFFENRAFIDACNHVIAHNSKLHLFGLVSTGNVHASRQHLLALAQLCGRRHVKEVFLHAFTDGRDSPPQEAHTVVLETEALLRQMAGIRIASIAGRYYAMDRDKRWERIEAVYRALVEGVGKKAPSVDAAITQTYAQQLTDEFIPPTVITNPDGSPVATVDSNDAVIFFNFRVDRPRQLTMAFVLPQFEQLKSFEFGYSPEIKRVEGKVDFATPFKRNEVLQNVFFVTMTNYQKNLPVSAVAFNEHYIPNALAHVIAESGLKQMHLSESEKERFVTYYFDGMHEGRLPGEEFVIIPSPHIPTYDQQPAMSSDKLLRAFLDALAVDQYHFFVMNFANPDMVAHTGNVQAAIKACESVDRCLGEIIPGVLSCGGTVLITADHGNAEEMLTYNKLSFFFTSELGRRNTDHSNSPVPIVIIKKELQGSSGVKLQQGSLSDIAPTVLGLMNIPRPREMTGRNLLTTG